ncbi:MAG: peptidase S41, partial [Bacteroidetes bacterium]
LIGRKTFGKGLVQTTRPVGYNSQVKITVAKYYTPSGRCIQAIDYSHRNPDGSVGKIPDSLMVAFNTASGRTVYDGGGITPDIEVKAEYFSPVAIGLLTEGKVFNYATIYYYDHPKAINMKDFVLSDESYTHFTKWLEDVDLEYDSDLERAVVAFEDAAKESVHYEELKADIEALKEDILHDQAKDLITNKQEIKEVLAEQIVGRYFLTRGEIANAITHDPDVTKAIEVLNNSSQYNELLTSKK